MLKEIAELAKKFDSVDDVKNELKRIQSVKCRLAKQKAKKTYETEMTKVVTYEQALKEVRSYMEPKELVVTHMTADDIKTLNFEETVRAIKSIQSKKCNSQYLTDDITTNEIYQDACRIENLLKEHKKTVAPVEETVVQKSKINDLINNIENLNKVSKDYIIEQLKNLL